MTDLPGGGRLRSVSEKTNKQTKNKQTNKQTLTCIIREVLDPVAEKTTKLFGKSTLQMKYVIPASGSWVWNIAEFTDTSDVEIQHGLAQGRNIFN